jgi:hypothetical protein
VNCVQFGVANAISNFPQKKRERTYYAYALQRRFARPDLRDAPPLVPKATIGRSL